MGDNFIGSQARLMSQALRKLTAITNKSKTCVMFINQLRDKIGVIYGSPETTTGGKALKFYSSVRMDIRKVDVIKDGSEIIGNKAKIKIVKNKMAPPFKVAEFDILYGKGIDKEGCIVDIAAEADIIQKSGSWYSYKGDKIGQGKDNARIFLRSNPEIMAEVEQQIRDKMGLGC